MRNAFKLVSLLPLIVAGCTSHGSSTISESPADWTPLMDRTVTVRGNAGNSPQGAIVRFDDGGYIPLKTRERWGIDAVGRPVIVTGKVTSGQGFRAERFMIDASSEAGGKIEVPPPDQSAKSSIGATGL